MARKILKIRPTKIELIKLKRRLKLATRIQKIVKDRLSILMMEFLQIAKETVEAKKRSLDDFTQAYRALSAASGYHGYIALGKEIAASERELGVVAGTRNVAGVKIPSIELKVDERKLLGYNIVDTSTYVDRSVEEFEKCLASIAELAELQTSMELIGHEINRTKRIVNALEYIIIPSYEDTIAALEMKFEERDREEKARLKRVKALVTEK
jgi:V/A-type H+-transporting ATPase subunit D